MVARKKASHEEDSKCKILPLKQLLVGGPLLGSRQRNIASDFAPWDQFEPLITPEVQLGEKGDQPQRFILLPHSHHITVLAYQTGRKIASLVPFMNGEEANDPSSQVLIETVCLAKFTRKPMEKTVQDVLNMEDDSDEEGTSGSLEEVADEVVVMAGCRDGSVREFSLRSLKDSSATGSIRCGSYHIAAPCHRPRRVIQVTKREPIMHLTSPALHSLIQEEGILTYMAVRTKTLDAPAKTKSEKSESMNITIIRTLIPHFDGNSNVSLLRKENDEVQRKWQLDKFKCRVSNDKVGGFMNTAPFRLVSVAKPIANDSTIFIVVARANAIHVYHDQALKRRQCSPLMFAIPAENPLTSLHVSTNNDDIACGHFFGEIIVMNRVLSEVEKYNLVVTKTEQHFEGKSMIGKPEDPRTKVIKSKAHWHAHPVTSLFYDTVSSPVDPILYSGGTESVLVTWQMGQGRSKPLNFLPRVSLGGIVHVACADRVDDKPSNGILVYSDDNSLQLFESYSKGRIWKIQGLASNGKDNEEQLVQKTVIEVDPIAKGALDAQLVITGLPQAPGFMHWYDATKWRLTATLEVAPFNKVSKTETDDNPMPVPSITNHAFCNDGKELITIDETPSENSYTGAFVNHGPNGGYGVVTTIKFWSWGSTPPSTNEPVTPAPYTLVAAMSFPHGPKNRVSALAGSTNGSIVCTVSNDEKAFRLWRKVIPSEGNETRRIPAWTCQCKVTIPAGFSNFETRRDGIAFSGDGSTLALGCGNMVTLWDCTEARFLTNIRHLEGVTGTIDTIKFVTSGRLQDVLLIKSDLGVSLQSPFGSQGGFKGWSWGVPFGVKRVIISSAEFLHSKGCVAITVFNSKTGSSRLMLIDAVTGKVVPHNEHLDGTMGPHDFEGRIVSMSVIGKSARVKSNWNDDTAGNADETVQLYGLSSNGNLSLFTEVGEYTIMDEWDNMQPPSGPTLTISQGRQKRKQYDEGNRMTPMEPIAKKSALELFGLVSNADNKGCTPATTELPSLSKNFVRAFVGRRLPVVHEK